MIDINELRQLAQAATPGPWIGCGPSFGGSLPKYLNEVAVDREGDEDDGYSICNTPIGLDEERSTDMAFIAAANPATVSELLDRLEEAERASAHIKEVEFPRKMRAVAVGWETKCARLEQERDALLDCLKEWKELAKSAEKERNAMRAKIEAMEKQEPVAQVGSSAERI